ELPHRNGKLGGLLLLAVEEGLELLRRGGGQRALQLVEGGEDVATVAAKLVRRNRPRDRQRIGRDQTSLDQPRQRTRHQAQTLHGGFSSNAFFPYCRVLDIAWVQGHRQESRPGLGARVLGHAVYRPRRLVERVSGLVGLD